MKITSATFVKGIVEPDKALEDGTPQIAFIGRSNAGKSSLINSLTGQKGLARTSSFPGRTQEINLFLINKSTYLVDLPGYGYTKVFRSGKEQIQNLITWYFFRSDYKQRKIVLVVDSNIGPTDNDLHMLQSLEEAGKDVVVVANKVDKLKKSEYALQIKKIQDMVTP